MLGGVFSVDDAAVQQSARCTTRSYGAGSISSYKRVKGRSHTVERAGSILDRPIWKSP